MAVNTAALKTFAPAMRRQLMEAVGRKLDLLLNSQTPDTLSTYAKQIAELREEQEKSREQLLERVAYTWFNRLCALRYLDAKGWHPFGCKVLMPADGSETQPELLKLMRSGSLPDDLKAFTNEQRLNQLLDGQIPTAIPGGDAQGEVYRELVLATCRSYHNLLPDLFEGLDDASELLLPDDLLTEGSIAGSFRSSISDSDCDDVEIIGWLYQFYISEKKDEVIGKVVKSEDIPAATQLFTPNWIVKYMVQNTIGAQWLATYPDSPLREQMEFYIEPVEQTDEVKEKLAEITPSSLNPEELTLMDPACGSGHILVEAYEIFRSIYLEQGYQLREIPKLIFEKNLFGIDIDKRAAQLSIFALIMKGRADDRRLFDRGIRFNVIALKDSSDFDVVRLAEQINLSEYGIQLNDLMELKQLFKHAPLFGSLIQTSENFSKKLFKLRRLSELSSKEMLLTGELKRLGDLAQGAELLASQYDAVATNPPYMGSSYHNPCLKEYLKSKYAGFEKDLFTCFIKRCADLLTPPGSMSFMTPMVWMFISSHKKIRDQLTSINSLSSLVQLEYNASGEARVPLCTFTALKINPGNFSGKFIRLTQFYGEDVQAPKALEAIHKQDCPWMHICSKDALKAIPGIPIAYWVGEKTRSCFQGDSLSSCFEIQEGLKTGDNDRFIRKWYEVNAQDIHPDSSEPLDNTKWVRHTKGAGFRKWYGNNEDILFFENDGEALKAFKKSSLTGSKNYFKENISWGRLTSASASFRYTSKGSIPNMAGLAMYADSSKLYAICALLNSKPYQEFLSLINPTLNFPPGTISMLPLPTQNWEHIGDLAKGAISIAKEDDASSETSSQFSRHQLINNEFTLQKSLEAISLLWQKQTASLKELEERINLEALALLNMTGELPTKVPNCDISLNNNPYFKGNRQDKGLSSDEIYAEQSLFGFLSFATGCMMGRYSLDHPGLILADSRGNQDEQLAAYEAKIGKPISDIQFKPDADAIIPVLDGEWFEDDIVARIREFLKVAFPESSVAENLRFIEDSIGKDIRTSAKTSTKTTFKPIKSDPSTGWCKAPLVLQGVASPA